MKILTCNTHSIVEKNYEEKTEYFIKILSEKNYDVIALQEVNQTAEETPVSCGELEESGYILSVDDKDTVIRKDNHIYKIAKKLREYGCSYFWTWCPIKLGYGKYDEGIGILSKHEPKIAESFYVSKSRDYYNWKTRKVIGIKINVWGKEKWFYSVHLGWWNDNEENFSFHWQELMKNLNEKISAGDVYIMGDFNNPAEILNEGYTAVLNSGWCDTYSLAEEKDNGITVSGMIDGWRNCKDLKDMRIDFIFKNNDKKVLSSNVIFNGKNKKVISDHFGVEMIEE